MTEGLLPPDAAEVLTPGIGDARRAVPGQRGRALARYLGAGAGVFAVTHIAETPGVYLDEAERTPETIAARLAEISDRATARRSRTRSRRPSNSPPPPPRRKGVKLSK